MHWPVAKKEERSWSRGWTANKSLVNLSLYSSLGLHRISFVCASEASSLSFDLRSLLVVHRGPRVITRRAWPVGTLWSRRGSNNKKNYSINTKISWVIFEDFSPIFEEPSFDRKRLAIFFEGDSPSSKNAPCSKNHHLGRTPSSFFEPGNRRTAYIFAIWSRRSKNTSPSSFFDREDRETPYLRSSGLPAFVRRPTASRPTGSPFSFCTSASLSIPSRSLLASSTLLVSQIVSRILPELHQYIFHSHHFFFLLHQALLHLHHRFANYFFGNDSGDFSLHGGFELFDRRWFDEYCSSFRCLRICFQHVFSHRNMLNELRMGCLPRK